MDRWVGKVAIVTGASAGIGAAVVQSLVKAGVLVVGLARRVDKLHALSANEAAKGKLYTRQCDVRKEDDLLDAFKWVNSELGGVDILVNNAGVGSNVKMINDNVQSYRDILDTNILATAICLREAVASMKSRDVHGHIINMNSILGHIVPTAKLLTSLYVPSKFAITGLTENVRKELNSEPNNKIKITSISPGVVKTEIHDKAGFAEGSAIYNRIPHLVPNDVANAVLYVLGAGDGVQVAELTIRPINEP